MSPRSRRTGFSLAEVMVFCLLLMMLLGGMYLLLVAGMRTVMQSNAYQTAQSQALIGIRAMVGEISHARAVNDYLIYSPGSPSIAFLSGFQPYPGGQDQLIHSKALTPDCPVLWQKWVGYWLVPDPDLQGSFDLVRVEDVITGANATTRCFQCNADGIPRCLNTAFSPLSGYPPVVGGVGTLIARPARPAGPKPGGGNWANPKEIARNIYALDFEPGPSSAPLGVVVRLYAQDATASDKVTQVQYRVTAWPSN